MNKKYGAGGSRTHVQTPASIFVYNHRLCLSLTATRHITQALYLRVYQSLIQLLDKVRSYLAKIKTCHQTRAIRIGSRLLVFRQLKRKNYYFLQLYLTGVLHPLDELQNIPHNACRIRNDPKTNTISISKCSKKCKIKN